MRALAATNGLLLALLVPAVASAQPEAEADVESSRFSPPDRVTGIAQLGVGWLTLPRALVCGEGGACRRGDTTPYVDLWNLIRLDFGLAFGAGITLGLIPTTDAPRDNPPGINRDHRRGYMTIESMARYYAWQTRNVEGWFDVGGGLVIVSDTFAPDRDAERYAFVGRPGVTLRTEGFSLLAGLGVSVVLSEYWTVGFMGRFGIWRLPDEPARTPLGDEASLSGTNSIVYAGINVSFRQVL